MKDRPIIFSGPMVRALLEGRKTQTRRVVNPQPLADRKFAGGYAISVPKSRLSDGMRASSLSLEAPYVHIACAYGSPGDLLWVKETFYAWGRWETRHNPKKGRDEWHFVDMTLAAGKGYQFAAPSNYRLCGRGGAVPQWWKRPAIFMPRAASRLTLRLTGVRVQRLQEIDEADAWAEGVQEWMGKETPWKGELAPASVHAYAALWEHINGAGSWAAAPWVWALTFEVIRANVGAVSREVWA